MMLQTPAVGGAGFSVKVGDFGLCRRLAPVGSDDGGAASPATPGSPGGSDGRLRVNSDSYGTVTHVAPETLVEGVLTQVGDWKRVGWWLYLAGWVAIHHTNRKTHTTHHHTPTKHTHQTHPPNTPTKHTHQTHMPNTHAKHTRNPQASDVYSFGVMLQEMLTGSRAWAGLSHSAIILQVSLLNRSLAVPDGLPAPLEQLLRSCLSRDPAGRPSFRAAAEALAAWLQESRGVDLSGTPVGRRADADAEAAAAAAAAGCGACGR